MSEKHLSQELLTLEGVEKSGFLLLVTLTRCASRDAFPKSWNPLFSTPSRLKALVTRAFHSAHLANLTLNVLPSPGALATSITAPCRSAIHRARLSPSPTPPLSDDRETSA